MTVATTNITSGPYTGTGAGDEFSYDFRVDDKTQLSVWETTDLGVKALLTVDTDYTVAGVGVDGGGILTRVAGNLPTDYIWYIRSNYADTQDTAFDSQGGFFPDVHEAAFDKLTFVSQQQQDEINRSIRLDESDESAESIDMSLPSVMERQSKFLGFDITGTPITSPISIGSIESSIISDLTTMRSGTVTNSESVLLQNHTITGDNGGGLFRGVTGAAPGTYVDNNGTIIVPGGGDGSAAWLREFTGAVNVVWFGARGDYNYTTGLGTDNTTIIQTVIDQFVKVTIPAGNFLIDGNIVLTRADNYVVRGIGNATILVSKSANGYMFQFEGAVYNVDFGGFKSDYLGTGNCGIVSLDQTSRGGRISGIYAQYFEAGIYLVETDAIINIDNITLFLPENNVPDSTGIHIRGNTVYMTNIEMIGGYSKGIYIQGDNLDFYAKGVSKIDGFNIAGTSSYKMESAIYVDGYSNLEISNGWIEHLEQSVAGDGKAIYISSANNVRLANLRVSAGSVYTDFSQIDMESVSFLQYGGGLITSDSHISYNNVESTEDENSYRYNALLMNASNSVVICKEKHPTEPYNQYADGFLASSFPSQTSNDSEVMTTSANTTEWLTGARSMDANLAIGTTGEGFKFEFTGLQPLEEYTFYANVKKTDNIDKIRVLAVTTDFTNSFRPRKIDATTDEWDHVKVTLITNGSGECSVKIISIPTSLLATSQFILDSVFMYHGFN